jgi:BTB/POZ domain-containing protein 3/6
MLNGGLAAKKSGDTSFDEAPEVEVPDVEPSAFLALLRYLYTDEIRLEDDNVLSVLYCSKKYLVSTLASACVSYLETSLNELNACLLLSQSRLFEEENLTTRCWEVIDAQAELALSSEGFVDIDEKTLRFILMRDTLNAKELSVFSALLRWSSNECYKQEVEDTPENQRTAMKDLIYLVRFPTMTLDEFANGPAQSEVLTAKEVTEIFLYFTAVNKPKVPFPTKRRTGLKVHTCHRFQSSAYRSNQWRYRGRCDSIQFSVDKRIFVVGFGLYGSSNGGSDYSVKMELKKTGQSKSIQENHTKFFSDGSSNTFPVYFKNAIQIEPDTTYTASVVLEGTELSFFGQDGLSEVPVDVLSRKARVNFSFQCSSDSTNGTGVQGGQIPEILFYAPTID